MTRRNYRNLWMMLILSMVLLAACGKHIESVQLQGYSMRPNFDDGQIFFIEKVALNKLQRGDLVLVGTGEKQWIKRLVGLPNETISIHDGSVFINGVLLDEPYEVIPPTYTMQEIKLDNNSYFVLGDNRPNSADSHVWVQSQAIALSEKRHYLDIYPCYG